MFSARCLTSRPIRFRSVDWRDNDQWGILIRRPQLQVIKGRLVTDLDGLDLAGIEAARTEAVRTLGGIANDAMRDGDRREIVICVRGGPLYAGPTSHLGCLGATTTSAGRAYST